MAVLIFIGLVLAFIVTVREKALTQAIPPGDVGGWIYHASANYGEPPGTVRVECEHTDAKGQTWSTI